MLDVALLHAAVGFVDLTGVISISATMPFSAQKSSISCVSASPPIAEPAIDSINEPCAA
jgi:hypothetical protein